MLTQCPKCKTTFRVTGAILRAAHGQVRCGQCNTQFDAIEYLIEGDTAATGSQPVIAVEPPASVPADAAAIEVEEPPVAEEIILEGRRIEISGVYRTLDTAEGAEHAHTQTIVQEFRGDEIVEAEESSAQPVDVEAEIDIDLEQNFTDAPEAETSLDAPSAYAPPSAQPDRSVSAPDEPVANRTQAAHRDAQWDANLDVLGVSSPRRPVWGWTLLCAALFLVLVAQLVHHYRQALSRRADIGSTLTHLYTSLGFPLEPQWELGAYSLKQWGVVSDPNPGAQSAGTLRVRASIANTANFAQPYPWLKLTLEDRFGAEVGTREFKPEEYLTSRAQAKRLMGAGESANADIAIVDPGEDAVGFQIKVCLPRAGHVQCTN